MAEQTKDTKDIKPTAPTGTSSESAAPRTAEERIDPRLDNRRGDQRPPLEEFPAKPQQIDGPELGEPAPARRKGPRDERPRKGMRSKGPHGLGNTEV